MLKNIHLNNSGWNHTSFSENSDDFSWYFPLNSLFFLYFCWFFFTLTHLSCSGGIFLLTYFPSISDFLPAESYFFRVLAWFSHSFTEFSECLSSDDYDKLNWRKFQMLENWYFPIFMSVLSLFNLIKFYVEWNYSNFSGYFTTSRFDEYFSFVIHSEFFAFPLKLMFWAC